MSLTSSLPRPYPVTRSSRRTALGLALSVLVHVVLFLVLRAKLNELPPPLSTPGTPESPLQVTFIKPPPPKPVPVPRPQPEPKPAAKPLPTPPKKTVARPAPRKPAPVSRPSAMASSQPVTQSPTAISAPPTAAPEQDFSAMINRNRERRQALEDSAAQENAAARAAENPSANDIARANIAFQEKRGRGQNGVFEIVSRGPRMAQYAFRGWTNDRSNSQKQFIDVDAGPGGNVDLAIVNSMIALIRKYYSGDFNWDSQRLGRVVVLSARQSDTRGLQDFLLKEFFSGS